MGVLLYCWSATLRAWALGAALPGGTLTALSLRMLLGLPQNEGHPDHSSPIVIRDAYRRKLVWSCFARVLTLAREKKALND